MRLLGVDRDGGVEAGVDQDRARRTGARRGRRSTGISIQSSRGTRTPIAFSAASRPSSRWNIAGGPIIRRAQQRVQLHRRRPPCRRAAAARPGGAPRRWPWREPYRGGRLPPPCRPRSSPLICSSGQVALVTGGGSGLGRRDRGRAGRAAARRWWCAAGALEPLEETVALCEDGRCEARVCDIREEDQVGALVDGVLERHGRIDMLVNNAGGQYMTPAEDITPKGFRTVIRLNVEGTWLMTHAVATKAMIPAEGGKIVNVTLSPHHGLPGHGALLGGARRGGEPDPRAVDRVGALRHHAHRARGGPLRHRDAAHEVPASRSWRAWRARCRCSGWAPRRSSPGWWPSSPRPAGDYHSGSIITIDGARDNWFGPWPPGGLADEAGSRSPRSEAEGLVDSRQSTAARARALPSTARLRLSTRSSSR